MDRKLKVPTALSDISGGNMVIGVSGRASRSASHDARGGFLLESIRGMTSIGGGTGDGVWSMIVKHVGIIGVSMLLACMAWVEDAAEAAEAATGEANRITLIVPDTPAAIPRAPGLGNKKPTQRDAAERLRLLIAMATGFTPAIVPAAETPTNGVRIYVGYGPHLKGKVTPPAKPEGLKIQESDGDLHLLGEIAPQGTNNWPAPTDRGLMHAVETYAERVLGYRFLFATVDRKTRKLTELGTVVPRIKTFRLRKGLLIEDAPAFAHRVLSSRPRDLIGLRTGSAPAFFCNHSYGIQWWAKKFGTTHPEMFIPRNPAKAGDAATAAMASQPNLRFLDYTEPLLLEKRLDCYEEFFRTGRGPGFYYQPTRKYMVEETIDAAAPTVRYNERSRALFDPKHHAWGNFSNIWFDYLNRMSAAAKQRWPNRDLRISTLAYMRHYGVPTFGLDDDIDVMVALMRTSMGNKEPEVFRKNLADVEKWSAHLGGDRKRLFLWEYGCWPAFWVSTPVICPNAMQKWLQAVRPMVSGVFFEMYHPNEYYFLMRRLWTRLLWDPDLDVNAEIRDLCERFFGPAGATMTAFYLRLIERYEMPWRGARLTWDQYYLDDDLYFRQSFPPEEIERLAALLEKAKREAGLPPVTRKQVAMASCVHLSNAGEKRVSVSVSVGPLKDAVTNPAVHWDTGRLVWWGTLQPGERLEVSGDGSAAVAAADARRRTVTVERQGELPQIDPGKSLLLRFRQGRSNATQFFEAELRYGTGKEPADGDLSIYARRLRWMADAYEVLPPLHKLGKDPRKPGARASSRGFFADARAKHQRMGLVPHFEPPPTNDTRSPQAKQADALIKSARSATARARTLAGEENRAAREKEYAAAAQSIAKALEVCPGWKIDDASPGNPWALAKARVERARLWLGVKQGDKARWEYEAALAVAPRQMADLRSYLYMLIGDSYADEKNWIASEAAYFKAQKTGLYGDRKKQVPAKLRKVKPLAEAQRAGEE